MAERPTVTVPDLVGEPVDIATEMAAAIGLLLSSGDPDGPGIRSRTWPGLFWVTAQDVPAGSVVERGTQMRVMFVEDGQTRSDVPAQTGGPLPSLESQAEAKDIAAVAALSTLASAVIALSLSRIDGRRDEYTLIAVGAKPRTQQLIAFWQALVLAGLGSLIGGAFALVPSTALAFANTILFAPPWTALITSILGVPLAIAVVALALRRSPRTAAPDRSLVG